MIMLPPTFISLPFKILLFVLVDGWDLVIKALVQSFHYLGDARPMNQDTVVNLATQAMSLASRSPGRCCSSALVVGLIVSVFQAVTQIQEQSLRLIPKIVARRGRDRRARALDARPARRLHDRAVHLDPDDGGHVTELLRKLAGNELAGFILVLARVTPLFMLAPLFSSAVIPPRVESVIAVGISIGLTPIAMHGQHIPSDLIPLAGLVVEGLLVGLGFAFALVRADGGGRIGRLDDRCRLGLLLRRADQPVTGETAAVMSRFYSLVGTRSSSSSAATPGRCGGSAAPSNSSR